jgi:hypothetical protein
VIFQKSRKKGSVSRLELVDPRAYGGKAAKGSQSGKSDIWSVGVAPVIGFENSANGLR